jgi:DNA polymerase-3 subunit delta
VPSFRAAYLIHGDDHGRIAERRARLRAMAETAAGTAGVELYENDQCTPENIVGALTAMTFAMGRRFVIADGVERWKEGDVDAVASALLSADPETLTVAFFAREEGRYKAPDKLHKAVAKAGGQIAAEMNVKAWDLPKWLIEQARGLQLDLDKDGAKLLVAQVGDRQQRLLRELEKLALEHGAGAAIGAEEVEESCAPSAESKVWDLADALVAGNQRAAIELLLELRQQGERIPGLIYRLSGKVREGVAVAEALAEGQPKQQATKLIRASPRVAGRIVAAVERRDVESLRRALVAIADLEAGSRGHFGGGGHEDTLAVRAVLAAAA